MTGMSTSAEIIAPEVDAYYRDPYNVRNFLFGNEPRGPLAYRALTNRLVNTINGIVIASPAAERSDTPNNRSIWLLGTHSLDLFSQDAAPEEPIDGHQGEIARADYIRSKHKILWVPSLKLSPGFYSRAENIFIDEAGDAQLEVILSKGLRHGRNVQLREHQPATEARVRTTIEYLQSVLAIHDVVPTPGTIPSGPIF